MKGNVIFCVLFGSVLSAYSAVSQRVNSVVNTVTMFTEGAQVERSKQLQIAAGESELVFTGLSPFVDTKSLQVKALSEDITILGVNFKTVLADSLLTSQLSNRHHERINQKSNEIAKVEAGLETIKGQFEVLKNNWSLINRTQNSTLAAVRELNDYYAKEMLRLKNEEVALKIKLKQLQEELKALSTELPGKPVPGKIDRIGEIAVTVSATRATNVQFVISYYVSNARWFPTYDISSIGTDEPIEIRSRANLIQNTGETWRNVNVVLSSGNPAKGNVAPVLQPYLIHSGGVQFPDYSLSATRGKVNGIVTDAETGEPLVGASVWIEGTTIGAATDIDGRYSLTLPSGTYNLNVQFIGYQSEMRRAIPGTMNIALKADNSALDEVVVMGYGAKKVEKALQGQVRGISTLNTSPAKSRKVESAPPTVSVQQAMTDFTFAIQERLSLDNSNRPKKVEIGRYQLPAQYHYTIMPRAGKTAYLMADLPGISELPLLDGEANVLFDNTYVGTTLLESSTLSDTLHLALGRDRNIVVERKNPTTFSERKFLASNKKVTKEWITTLL